MEYSPKLKKAMEEIKEVLKKHDIAGVIAIHTPGHCEYLNQITPSYSCAKIDELKGSFELKGKKEHFSNESERYNKLRDTANMLHLLSTVIGSNILHIMQASDLVDKHLNSEYFGGGHSSHSKQNN